MSRSKRALDAAVIIAGEIIGVIFAGLLLIVIKIDELGDKRC